MTENKTSVCLFNKFGYCKFSKMCFKKHKDTECAKDMGEIKNCPLRHPKVCKYFKSEGFCKFGQYCRFKHVDPNKKLL